MKQKLLLFVMMLSFSALFAQNDTIKTLIISEARYDWSEMCFVELTNVGTEAINLEEFEFGRLTPWNTFPEGEVWPTEPPQIGGSWLMLPAQVLEPGESYVLANFHNWQEIKYADEVAKNGYSETWPYSTKPEMYKLADLQVHIAEQSGGDPRDSVSIDTASGANYSEMLSNWSRETLFLRHHLPNGDSAVVDQVGGIFTDPDGTNPDLGQLDVAGMSKATRRATLVRRFDVKQGNLTFVRGTDLEDSEWIPIPHVNQWGESWEPMRKVFWTVGNHGDYNVDEATLTSSTIDINWTDNILTVPWGVRNDDSIMSEFNKVPGLAWHYHYSADREDSAFVSVRTGDSLTIYACGNDLSLVKFGIVAAAPTADANIVIPKRSVNSDGDYRYKYKHATSPKFWNFGARYYVSDGLAMDTISGIVFATRVDTLFKYLEKASNATWEIVEVDGIERTDLKNGDILKVTAEDASTKEYFLKVDELRKSKNAFLSSITWPDIPESYKGIFGWTGDTIPEFGPSKYDYKVTVPWDVDGIPALVAKNQDDNGSNLIDRATNLSGTLEDRTATITSKAENDTTIFTYSVILQKEKELENVQPWAGEPFISQYTLNQNWNNCMMEIVNPGNLELDLSNYMIYLGNENDPALAISGWDDWENRYQKYIPGYKWQTEGEWTVQRSIAIPDLNVNSIVWPGDVFVMADIVDARTDPYTYRDQIDIDFNVAIDHFGEAYAGVNPVGSWDTYNIFIYKILNDSIKAGLKPADDPNDFQLVEMFGAGDGTGLTPLHGGTNYLSSWTRLPEIYGGNTLPGGSLGDSVNASEWNLKNEVWMYANGYVFPEARLLVPMGTGSHFMDDVTVYRSTVASLVYIPSQGYSMSEEIRGVVTGTTVDVFLGNILKADVDQALTVIAVADGSIPEGTASVMNGDTLVVISADSTNVTKYTLEVTDNGLSDDAVLTSTDYTVNVAGETGTVEGMEYGTTLQTVVDNVVLPAGASLMVVDADGYVPFKMLNFDTMYVDVTVTDQIYFEVVAEDMHTMITYQLKPNASESDAFVTSNVFMIDQTLLLISLVPQGTNVVSFFANLVPSPGATLSLTDKLGIERPTGIVVRDDKLVVTAADGVTTKTYYLTLLDGLVNYLAYVLSDEYLVDQNALTIVNVLGTQSVTDFKGNVTPSTGATLEVQNSDGSAKGDSDMMVDGDMLHVTAGNGVTVVTYVIGVNATAIEDPTDANLRIYPNPSTGKFNIAGAEIGSRVRVYNVLGATVRDVVVHSDIEMLSLDNEPGGLFFITISDKDEIVGQFKVIKQ